MKKVKLGRGDLNSINFSRIRGAREETVPRPAEASREGGSPTSSRAEREPQRATKKSAKLIEFYLPQTEAREEAVKASNTPKLLSLLK